MASFSLTFYIDKIGYCIFSIKNCCLNGFLHFNITGIRNVMEFAIVILYFFIRMYVFDYRSINLILPFLLF